MKLQLKFREDASDEQREQVIDDLSAEGASAVRPLFPDATDGVRASLYIVDLSGASEMRVLSFLDRADAVEFAEPEVRRRLVR
jgi:hypothetical protein